MIENFKIDWKDQEPLLLLAKNNKIRMETVKYFFEKGLVYDKCKKDENGNTIVHLFCQYNKYQECQKKIVEFLIEQQNFEFWLENGQGDTILDTALQSGNLSLIKYLFENFNVVQKISLKNPSIDKKKFNKENFVFIACESYFNFSLSVVKYLVEQQHCDINALNLFHETPLLHVLEKNLLNRTNFIKVKNFLFILFLFCFYFYFYFVFILLFFVYIYLI